MPVAEIEQAPFDPFLYVHDTNYEIHLPGKLPALSFSNNTLNNQTSFLDENGFPFAIVVPDNWQPPLAGIDMGISYPNFINFVNSNGKSAASWYQNPVIEKIKPITPSIWKW